jgi:hypothetical protein
MYELKLKNQLLEMSESMNWKFTAKDPFSFNDSINSILLSSLFAFHNPADDHSGK